MMQIFFNPFSLFKKKSVTFWHKIKHIVLAAKWWEIVLVLLFIISIVIVFTPYTQIIKDWADILTNVLTPISIILGIILGYPLLKKKLTEQHILREFDIMDAANRSVRHKIVELQDKHKPENVESELKLDYVNEILNDITELRQLALDATPEVFRYINLIYKSLVHLSENFPSNATQTLTTFRIQNWFQHQLHEAFSYSKSIGIVPTGETINKSVVNNKRILPYISNNNIIEIKDIAHSIDYYHDDAMLVVFFSITIKDLNDSCIPLYKSIYNAAPSPAPYARLLLSDDVYIPLILLKNDSFIGLPYQVQYQLIGYKRMKRNSTKGEEYNYYICIYSSVISSGFLDYGISDINSLTPFRDAYLNSDFDIKKFRNFKNIDTKTFSLEISVEEALSYFISVKSKLEKKLYGEKRK